MQKTCQFAMIILVVFTIIRVIGAPMSLKARSDMCFRGCQSNVRLIEGAIESYNMDHPGAHMQPDVEFAAIESRLVDSGYLKAAVHCPGSYDHEENSFLRFLCGIYLHTEGLPLPPGSYSLPATGSISCSLHGPLLP